MSFRAPQAPFYTHSITNLNISITIAAAYYARYNRGNVCIKGGCMRARTRRFSARFWFHKVGLLLAAFLLLYLSWWLWSYQEDADTLSSNETAPAEQQEETAGLPQLQTVEESRAAQLAAQQNRQTDESEQNQEDVFPFTFDGNDEASDFPGISADFNQFTYDFRPNAKVRVDREGLEDIETLSRDFVWKYELRDGKAKLTSTPIDFCTGDSNCGLGNGVMEILVVPAENTNASAMFYVTDSGEVTEFTAVDTYKPLIESYKEL